MFTDQEQKLFELACETGEMNRDEYSLIADTIYSIRPCNLLIFGAGRDSRLWHILNNNGKTVFIESDERWYRKTIKKNEDINIDVRFYTYKTKKAKWRGFLDKPEVLRMAELDTDIISTSWDCILIDGPKSFTGRAPGRMQSIYQSYLFLEENKEQFIFIHDIHRRAENEYSIKFFGTEHKDINHLRMYKI